MNRSVFFATSNKHKFEEARFVFADFGIDLKMLKGKGVEIQSEDLSEIARNAARSASTRFKKPLIVEDAGLFIRGLGGFPGPYSSYVFQTIGTRGILKLLRENDNRSAEFKSSLAFCEPGGKPVVFGGRVKGKIAIKGSGDNGFGFDPIFTPRGRTVTFAYMNSQEKSKISHRGKAMRKFAVWLKSF